MRYRNGKEIKMLAYYGYTISPNQIETVEGFLICRNVPIARTGEMDYLESELMPEGSSSKMVKVFRSPDEVFSEANRLPMNTHPNFSRRTHAAGIPEDTPRTSGRETGSGKDAWLPIFISRTRN